MRNNQKGISELIFIIIIVVLLGVVGYFVYQNNQLQTNQAPASEESEKMSDEAMIDEMSEWETFTDNNGRFGFSYDSDIEINHIDDGVVDKVVFYSFSESEEGKAPFQAAIYIVDNHDEISLDQYILEKVCMTNTSLDLDSHGPSVEYQQRIKDDCSSTFASSKEPTVISGIEGIKANVSFLTNKEEIRIIERNRTFYVFRLDEFGNIYPSEDSTQILDQILSTFQFTN